MANKKVQIQIDTKATGNGAQQAQQSLQALDKTAQKASGAVNTTTASTSKLGSIAGQAGFQIQDFAVQVGAGTSALTAFSQQAPQLLGVFGPTGAIAGAIVAIGAVAAKVFMGMSDNAEEAGKAMEEMAEKLKDAFSADAKKQIDEFNTTLELSANKSLALRDAELQLAQATRERDQSNSRLIDSQLKLDEAQIKYLASTGQIKNAEEALLAVRQKAAEATKQAEIQAAQNQVTAAREQYQAIVDQRKQVDDDVAQAQKRLVELEAQQQKLLQEQNFRREQDKRLTKAGVLKEGQTSIESQAVAGQLDGIEKQIANLYQIIERAPARIEEISTQAITQAANVDAAIINAQTQIQEIEGKFQLSQKAQEITTATEKINQSAQDIEKAIGGFEPVTQAQALAKESIMQAVSDGMITAQEQQQIGTQLQVLMSSLQTGQTSVLNTLQELIKMNAQLAVQMGRLQPQVQAAKNSLPRGIN